MSVITAPAPATRQPIAPPIELRDEARRPGVPMLWFDGEAQSDGDRWYLRLTVEGERDDANLQHQLSKLYDCLSVEVSPCR